MDFVVEILKKFLIARFNNANLFIGYAVGLKWKNSTYLGKFCTYPRYTSTNTRTYK